VSSTVSEEEGLVLQTTHPLLTAKDACEHYIWCVSQRGFVGLRGRFFPGPPHTSFPHKSSKPLTPAMRPSPHASPRSPGFFAVSFWQGYTLEMFLCESPYSRSPPPVPNITFFLFCSHESKAPYASTTSSSTVRALPTGRDQCGNLFVWSLPENDASLRVKISPRRAPPQIFPLLFPPR